MVSELILAFVFFDPLGIVLVELLGGAADSLTDKEEKEKGHNAFMLKQEHTIGFCDGVMCVLKTLQNERRDNNRSCKELKTNGDRVRAMSDEELAEFAVYDCCGTFREAAECKRCLGNCIECALAWLRQDVER